MKLLYQCQICKEIYDSPEEATICEQITTPPPLFEVGQEVFILQRYPSNKSKPLVRRIITAHILDGHFNYYYINKYTQIGKRLYLSQIGIVDEYNRAMLDDDYLVYCFKLGDQIDLRFEYPQNAIVEVTLDLVNEE